MWYGNISFTVNGKAEMEKERGKKNLNSIFSPLSHVHTIRLPFDYERNLSDLFGTFSSFAFTETMQFVAILISFIKYLLSLSTSPNIYFDSTPFSLQLKNNNDDADGDGMEERKKLQNKKKKKWSVKAAIGVKLISVNMENTNEIFFVYTWLGFHLSPNTKFWFYPRSFFMC